MKNHQKQRKFTLVFDGIRVAFSHPLGLTEGGPAYYGVPTPQECRAKPDDLNYIVCASLLPLDTISDRLYYITASQSFPGIQVY